MLGGLGRKAGMAALGYMAYRAYRDRQGGGADIGSPDTSGGGIGAMLGDLANRFGLGGAQEPADAPGPEDEQAAEAFSDDKALLLIRAMIAAAHSDGVISPDEHARIMHQLDEAGADGEDRRIVAQEIAAPRSLDALIGQVADYETALEVYLASRTAIEGATQAQRAYLSTLRERLGLSEADAAEIDAVAAAPRTG